MKVKLFILLSFLILFAISCNQAKQSDSRLDDIDFPKFESLDVTEKEFLVTNLELLGKLWGFLKYHHPAIGKGNYDWDNELFQMIPQYLKVNSTEERDEVLLHWIEKYGEIPECKTCKETPADAVLKPDFSWVEESDMSAFLKAKIMEIYQNRYQGRDHYYVSILSIPVFPNEKSYSKEKNPNIELRLLALYRYWNIIQYFFPYKHLTDTEWNDVLKKYIPKFIEARTGLEYQLVVQQLTVDICDTHAYTLLDKVDSLKGMMFAPFLVTFVENKLVVDQFFTWLQPNGSILKTGDIITHINGKSVESIVDSIKIFYPASNESVRKRIIAHDLLRSRDSTILIDFITSNNTARKVNLKLYDNTNYKIFSEFRKRRSSASSYKVIEINNEESIGYINLASINDGDIDTIKQLFKDRKGIIIDIRNYPNAIVFKSLGSFFVTKKRSFSKFTFGNVNKPGEFTFTNSPAYIDPDMDPYNGKLVVIVNEHTQSTAEYHTMAFRAGDNTTIIGSQTAGADGNVTNIILPGGLKTYFSGIGVYYPDGRETQRIGIVPDIEVKPTIKGIMEGRDELLEKAIEIIRDSKR